jgi:hypothetical protein
MVRHEVPAWASKTVSGSIADMNTDKGIASVARRHWGSTDLVAIEGVVLRHHDLLVALSRSTERTFRTLHVRGQR